MSLFSVGNDSLLHRVVESRRGLDSGHAWIAGADRSRRLDYDFRLLCAESYYGRDCNLNCKPRNDSFGHYECDENGEKICLPGYTGEYCTKRKSWLFLISVQYPYIIYTCIYLSLYSYMY